MKDIKARILVVEDEPDIRRFVRMSLASEGHEVHEADSVRRGLIEAGTRRPDLVVLDLGLPDEDGIALIRDLRTWSDARIIILSARSREDEKIAALDAGGDDYLVKPFGAGELLARVRVQLRHRVGRTPSGETTVRFGAIEIDLVRRVVLRDGETVHLTPIEYRLLTHLTAQPDRVITHRQLLLAVWGPGHDEDAHYVRVHMANLRKKIEGGSEGPKHLLTETGVGYRFLPEARAT